MKTAQINKLIKTIVKEHLEEAHQQGEWWIDNGGQVLQQGGSDQLMQSENWKKMKASADKIEITTWELSAQDLSIILQGVKKIMGAEPTEEDPDATVGKDGYTGPRIDLTIAKKNKSFKNVPLAILEKCLPSRVKNYEKGKEPELAGPVNEDKSYHHLHKDYRLYEGDNHIVAIFEDDSRLVFEVHFHENKGEDREKWRRKAFTKWKTLANEIYHDVQLTEVGNPIQHSWKESFTLALKDDRMKEFIRTKEHHRVFDN